jgi:hypothetical protein
MAVQSPKLDGQTEIGWPALTGSAVPNRRDAASPVEDSLQRNGHGVSEEGKGVDDVALPRSVPPNEKGRIGEFDLLTRKAPKALERQGPNDRRQHVNRVPP